MSRIGNNVVELGELIGAVMALEPFDEFFAIGEVNGCDYCGSCLGTNWAIDHHNDCPVVNLRKMLKGAS